MMELNSIKINTVHLGNLNLPRIRFGECLRGGGSIPPQPDPTYPAGCIHRSKNYGRSNGDANRDRLIDLSGTGTDIQLYNVGYALNSGFGLYGFDLTKLEVINSSVYDGSLVNHKNNTIKFEGTFGDLKKCAVRLSDISKGVKKFKFKCTNIPDGKVVDVQIKDGTENPSINKTLKNGINTFEVDFTSDIQRYYILSSQC